MALVGVAMVGAGVLVVRIARRAAEGQLGPNVIAGIRTKATRSSPEAWAAAHAAGLSLSVLGGWTMAVAGVAAPIVGLVVGGTDDSNKAMGWWTAIVLLGIVASLGLVIAGALRGQAAAKAVVS